MGQELLSKNPNNIYKRKTRYFLATSSTGLRAVRGSQSKVYSHACIATVRSDWGWVTSLWSSRLDLAEKNVRAYDRYYKESDTGISFEAVETKEITSKEARVIKKEINLEVEKHKLNESLNALTQHEQLSKGRI